MFFVPPPVMMSPSFVDLAIMIHFNQKSTFKSFCKKVPVSHSARFVTSKLDVEVVNTICRSIDHKEIVQHLVMGVFLLV